MIGGLAKTRAGQGVRMQAPDLTGPGDDSERSKTLLSLSASYTALRNVLAVSDII